MVAQLNRAWMTTATLGTGTVTLGSARSADYFTFAEAGAIDGRQYNYVILDGSDVEIGVGTYTASGTTFSRDTVVKSRIAGTAGTTKLTLSGNATIFLTTLASDFRDLLTANRTYYVRTDGNDSNTGLANSAGGAFLTIQKAIDQCKLLDFNGYNVTIQVGAGTYTGGVVISRFNSNTGNLTIQGDPTTPSNVVISTTSANAINSSADVTIDGFKLQTTTSGACLGCYSGTMIAKNLEFGACAGNHVEVYGSSSYLTSAGTNWVFSGSASAGAGKCINVARGGNFEAYNSTITMSGSPSFANFFYLTQGGQASLFNMTYSGAATGKRYYITDSANLETFGGLLSAIPGNAPGFFANRKLFLKQGANRTLTNTTASQKLFDTATNGSLALATGTYFFEATLYITGMSGTSGNAQFQIKGGSGTATLSRVMFTVHGIDSSTPLTAGTYTASGSVTESGTASMVTAATGTGLIAHIKGTFNVTSGGTIIPSIALVTGAAATLNADSYFWCQRETENGTNFFGEWT